MAKHLSVILKQYSDVISGKLPASKFVPLKTGDLPGVDYAGKMPDERDFVASHSVEKHADRNGNGDELFNASNIGRAELGRHGHVPSPTDVKVYQKANEEVEYISEREKPTHQNPLVTVHDKDGLATHNLLSVANDIHNTKVKAADIHKGEVKVTGGHDTKKALRFKLSKHHASEVKEEIDLEEKYSGFEKTKKALAAKGAKDPAALAAWIGRKKYGKEKFQKAAAEGKKLKEAKDEGEYGYEGEMAMSQIKSIMNHSNQLMKILKPDSDLPEWVQSKITLAADYIQTAADYYATEISEAIEDPTIVARKKQMDKNQTHEIEFADKPGQKFTAMGPAPETHEIEFADKPGQKFTAMGPAPKADEKKSEPAPYGVGSDGKPYKSSIYPDNPLEDAEKTLEKVKKLSSGAQYKPYLKSAQYQTKNLRDMFKEAAMCENCGKSPCACDTDDMPKDKSSKGKKLLLDKAKKSLQEKAESVAQQKLMAMALSYKRGEMPEASEEVKKLASSMTEKQLRDFAKTKHSGLPQHVQKEQAPASTPITFPVTNSREGFKL